MKCPYCGSPGFPRATNIYAGDTCEYWVCVKCPAPVTYSSNEKKIGIWVLHNENWFCIVYLAAKKQYIVRRESFDLRVNREETREEYAYNGEFVIELPSEENVTPANASEKLALWLTFS